MQWSDIPRHPSPRTLRQFAGLWLVCFGLLAFWHGWVRGSATLGLIWGLSAVALGPLGLVKPQLMRPVFVGWMIMVFPIGWAVSHVLLAGLYYGLFTPLGLIFRLRGRDRLARQPRPDLATYWTSKPMNTDLRSYFRQF